MPHRPFVNDGISRLDSSLYPSTGDLLLDYLYHDLYVLPIVSDPTEVDSDGDGYADGPIDALGNGKFNDPRRMKCDVFSYSLSREEYVSIDNGKYYGGSQSWFLMYNYDIKCAGCGIIAAADSLIYLEQNNADFAGLTEIENMDMNGSISMNDYFEYVDRVYQYITPTHLDPIISALYEKITGKYYSAIGILPYKFSDGLKSYLSDHNIHATINYVSDINDVIDSLKKDIPVYGYAFSLDKDYKIECEVVTNAGEISDRSFSKHWFVVTGVYIDNILGEKICTFSTYGKKGTLDYETYYSILSFYFLTF